MDPVPEEKVGLASKAKSSDKVIISSNFKFFDSSAIKTQKINNIRTVSIRIKII